MFSTLLLSALTVVLFIAGAARLANAQSSKLLPEQLRIRAAISRTRCSPK